MSRIHLAAILAAAALSGCGGESDDLINPGERPVNSIRILDRAETLGSGAFSPNPHEMPLAIGPVYWYNDDAEPSSGQYGGSNGTVHNIVSNDGIFNSGNLVPGARFQHTFEQPGSYGYHCGIHPTMVGTITVTP